MFRIPIPFKPPQPGAPNRLSPEKTSLPLLSLAALGVVFGDLGTSPLYALQEAFHPGRGVVPTPANVTGIVSLFLWSLILMVSIKYVVLLMRAGNRGEGGILALLALILGESQQRRRRATRWLILGLLGTAMLYGDGIITPAVSVLSAVEGLNVAAPQLHTLVVPLTVCLLIALFTLQSLGSAKVGRVFGPVLACWFIAIGLLGAYALFNNPAILAALNPLHGLAFFRENGFRGFESLGAVVLCLTGAEALYADMGHFGARPIRLAWYGLALPALLLSYLGQGALLLAHPELASRPFYSMVPAPLLYPMIALATLATIVASQALITAIFSLTRQAVQLGLWPRLRIRHTSGQQIGQVYLPLFNGLMMVATIVIVIGFGSSERLAAAFGLAVSATMTITTLLFAVMARRCWHWSWLAITVPLGGILLIDLAFAAANALKIADGGWLPLLIGLMVFAIMGCWHVGRRLLQKEQRGRALPLKGFFSRDTLAGIHRIDGVAVFMTEEADSIPLVLLHHLKHNRVLHKTVVFCSVHNADVPWVAESARVSGKWIREDIASVTLSVGFMENPDVPAGLANAFQQLGMGQRSDQEISYYLGRQVIAPDPRNRRWARCLLGLFALLRKNERSATMYFSLPPNRVIEVGARVELRL